MGSLINQTNDNPNFSIFKLEDGETLEIPVNQQMVIVGQLELEAGSMFIVPAGAKFAILRES